MDALLSVTDGKADWWDILHGLNALCLHSVLTATLRSRYSAFFIVQLSHHT